MKSRTSLFNGTVLKKDIIRFCPVWIIYASLRLMSVLGSIGTSFLIMDHYNAYDLAMNISSMAFNTFVYAIICALMLFGDLFKGRLCNALHALPLRRESWFATHALAGVLFFLMPSTAAALLYLPFLGELWFIAPMWLLAGTAMFLFFFGIAIVCIMLTGSRFASTAVYILINFFAMLCYWFVDAYYAPLLPGLHIKTGIFSWFCPTIRLANFEYFRFTEEFVPGADILGDTLSYHFQGFSDGWGYIGIIFALSIAFFALALVMYRKRQLESAGNFLAFPKAQPVFLIVFALAIGALFQTIFGMFGAGIITMAIGMVIGCYAGQMLVRRTVTVFDKRSGIWCGVLAGSIVLTLIITAVDPLGLTRWTPEPDQVKSITISNEYNLETEELDSDFAYLYNTITVSDPEDIENLISIHENILTKKAYVDDLNGLGFMSDYITPIYLTYHMADGRDVARRYYVADESIYNQLKPYFSATDFLLGYDNFESFYNDVNTVYVDDEILEDQTAVRSLLEAVWADCENGNMAQTPFTAEHYIQIDTENRYICLDIYEYSEKTMKWIKERENTH